MNRECQVIPFPRRAPRQATPEEAGRRRLAEFAKRAAETPRPPQPTSKWLEAFMQTDIAQAWELAKARRQA
jgi:hypothetical protein